MSSFTAASANQPPSGQMQWKGQNIWLLPQYFNRRSVYIGGWKLR
jgi:hypothetical protein